MVPTRTTHLKLGPGGLSDIEWTVQLLQMQHAGQHRRAAHDQDAGGAAGRRGARPPRRLATPHALAEAWRFASRARNATVQVRGKPSDQLPRDARERAAVASVLQYPPGASDEMLNDYLRTARRARGVVDRIFWA